MAKFVHLHGHTQFSLLDGLSKIPQLVKTVKDLGMEAIAITDHGVMYGAIEFYKACLAQGIKPIIGVEMYVARRNYTDKEGKQDAEPYHLTVLAKNYQGYLNLMKLTTKAHIEGYYYRPRVDKKLLKEYSEGLIALSGCPSGELIRSMQEGDISKGEEIIKSYQEIFEENFYLEMQNHPYDKALETATDPDIREDLNRLLQWQITAKSAIKQYSQNLGVKIVATNDFHYIQKDDAQAQDALLCVQTGKLLTDTKRLRMVDAPDYYVKSPEEMAEAFKDLPQALENTVRIAEQVNIEIPLGVAKFPVFQTSDSNPMAYLRKITYEKGALKIKMTDPIKERLEYELGVIEKTKYADYFLVVADFMEWAHERGIITNTRGSAAASMVLYCLGVTNLNPLDYLLPFERFLTVDRPTLPDIDADIADDRRDEVIHYVMDKYGADRVAHIVTFGTMMGRAAIRDVGRVSGMAYGDVDRIAKLVPPPHQGFHKPLSQAIKEVPDLDQMYKHDPQVKKLLDLAVRIEGTVRHASVHAAGIVIAPDDITNFTPLQKEASGEKLVAQYDMKAVEDAGLVKMDLLGIRNLSILGKAVEFVKENQKVEVDLSIVPIDDKKTFALLASGETMGLFQLEGGGMTRYVTELKPTSIFDIQAMVALYRPGPMSVIPEYIARKHDPKKVNFIDDRMKDYTKQSLGLLVYQDDVLLTAINIAGYSWTEADKFRKAMGKKIPAEMAKQKGKFIEGCIRNGVKRNKAEEIFALIAPFAAYGFNKAHAASYAMIAYQTAYMKANFPVEFMAALMSAEAQNIDKIATAIEECKRLKIVVLPPDINYSYLGFKIENLKELSSQDLERQLTDVQIKTSLPAGRQGLRFGLSAIKNVGELAIESILKSRADGPFLSLFDLCKRVDTRLVNRKSLESLIKAGALDKMGSRAAQLVIIDQALQEAHKLNKDRLSGQGSLFDSDAIEVSVFDITLPDIEELPLDQLLIFEKELLGFYLHEPPYLALLQKLDEFISMPVSDITDEHIGSSLVLGGVITQFKKVLTKKSSKEMAFITISNGLGSIDCVVFPTIFDSTKSFLDKDVVILLVGRIDKREEELSFVIEKITQFDPGNVPDEFLHSKAGKSVEIYVAKGTDVVVLQTVNRTLRTFPGKIPVCLLLPGGGSELKRLTLPFSIDPDPLLESEITKLLGLHTFKIV